MLKTVASDARSRAVAALSASPIHALRELTVVQNGNTLTLSGMVDTFYHKQLAQELVQTVAEECDLVNGVDVDYVPHAPR